MWGPEKSPNFPRCGIDVWYGNADHKMGMGLYGWRAKCGRLAGEQKNGQSLQRKPGWKCANKMATPDKIPLQLGLEISMVCLFRYFDSPFRGMSPIGRPSITLSRYLETAADRFLQNKPKVCSITTTA